MNFLEKKSKVIIILLVLVICISIYLFINDNNSQIVYENSYSFSTNEIIHDNSTIKVHITGEVQNPGIIEINENSRIADVIDLAGGLTSASDISKINLAYKIKDGQKIYIPSKNDEADITPILDNAGKGVIIEDQITNHSLININTASQNELETLPGIGASTAQKIIIYREQNGDFKKLDDIMNVPGIGNSKYNNIKDLITV